MVRLISLRRKTMPGIITEQAKFKRLIMDWSSFKITFAGFVSGYCRETFGNFFLRKSGFLHITIECCSCKRQYLSSALGFFIGHGDFTEVQEFWKVSPAFVRGLCSNEKIIQNVNNMWYISFVPSYPFHCSAKLLKTSAGAC